MPQIYANPALFELYKLYKKGMEPYSNIKTIKQFLIRLDSRGLGGLWNSFDKEYGDSEAYQWWTSEGYSCWIGGFELDETNSWTLDMLKEIEDKIRTNSEWNVPLTSTYHPSTNHSPTLTSFLSHDYPNFFPSELHTLKGNVTYTFDFEPSGGGKYVKIVEIQGRVFNSILFTLHPGKGWPRRTQTESTLNYPGGIVW
jgi:hypothetical protein